MKPRTLSLAGLVLFASIAIGLESCSTTAVLPPGSPSEAPPAVEPIPAPPGPQAGPALKAAWDAKAFGPAYTALLSKALDELGSPLLAFGAVGDASTYCPKYSSLPLASRKAVLVMMISTMTLYESSFNTNSVYTESFPDSNGNLQISAGLLQESLDDAGIYGCDFKAKADLLDPGKNLRCGVKILAKWVPRDGVLGSGAGTSASPARGGARYWSVLREGGSHKHAQIAAAVSALPYCK